MKAPLKKSIQNKFNTIHLTDDKLDGLMVLQDQTLSHDNGHEKGHKKAYKQNHKTGPFKNNKAISFKILGLAAVMLLTLSLFLTKSYEHNMPFEIATEVTHHHFKLKPLEVQSSVLSEVSNYFTKLDFKPIPSKLISNRNLTLLGARYCSLQGITAAQIRYQSESGEVTTFYEVPYTEAIYSVLPDIGKGEEPLVSYSKGVGVKIWVEKGILMAMTI
ncbi:MAG: hypothetical protein ACJAS1_004880 [Oleiphilaceae bacterium]|jgi:hypothetical protein